MPFKIKIWDLPTRLFHWLLVVLLVFLWYSAEIDDDLMEWHLRAGKALFALLLYRVVWGLLGSHTARFSHFIQSPAKFFRYLSRLCKKKPDVTIGHNPAGGYMVVVMMLLLFIQTISGLCNSDDIFYEGSWYQYVSESTASWMAVIHHNNFDVLVALIAIHLLAILSYYLRGDNLVLPMLSGNKIVEKATEQPSMINALWAVAAFSTIMLLVFYWV
jgi:cytochrome b